MNEVIQKTIQIEENKEYLFRNQVDFCIGTGRMGLALTKEYQEQLSLVQKEIGFSHIRGHGLFCDDIGIYQETPEGESEYNFTYLDRVMDSYISLGLRPFWSLALCRRKWHQERRLSFTGRETQHRQQAIRNGLIW